MITLLLLILILIFIEYNFPPISPWRFPHHLFEKSIEEEAHIEVFNIFGQLEKVIWLDGGIGETSIDLSELDFEAPKTVNENGTANYTYEIISANNSSFNAKATAITDFDGDGVFNVWEINENGNPKQVVKD